MDKIKFLDACSAHPRGSMLLADINLSLHSGTYALAGRNGAGKPTLLRLIMGEISPVRGKVILDGIKSRGCLDMTASVDSMRTHLEITDRQLWNSENRAL